MSSIWDRFKCQRCGKCCVEIGLPWDPHRINQIAKFLNLSRLQLIERYYGKKVANGRHWKSEDHKRSPCPFLKAKDGIKHCAIYSVRPEGCRLYPLETDWGRGGIECPAARIVYDKLDVE